MRSRIVAGIAAGLAIASFGPILPSVGEHSGNHLDPEPGTQWVRIEERNAARAFWHAQAPEGADYSSDAFELSVWTEETTLTTAASGPRTAYAGRTLLRQRRTAHDGSVAFVRDWTAGMHGANTLVTQASTGALVLNATLESESQACSIRVVWKAQPGRTLIRYVSVNATETESYGPSLATGSCVAPNDRLDGGDYDLAWRRIDRRSSDDVVRDDALSPRGIVTLAGVGEAGDAGDGGPARWAFLAYPSDVAAGPDGSVYIVEQFTSRIRRVSPGGTIGTFLSQRCTRTEDGIDPHGGLCSPSAVAVGSDGSVYVSDSSANVVRRITADGEEEIVAGLGTAVEPRRARDVALANPQGLAVDGRGRLYVADNDLNRVRRIDRNGRIRTVAGDGTCAPPHEGAQATRTSLCDPTDVAIAPDGTIYVTHGHDGRVSRIAADGTLTTVLQRPPDATLPGVGSISQMTGLNRSWWGVAVGPDGAVYLSSSGRVERLVAPGIVVPVAGAGFGYTGDGGPAIAAGLYDARGLAFDAQGNLLIATGDGHTVRLADVGASR